MQTGPTQSDAPLASYAASRRTQEGAESYATKYDRQLHKRISSYFERRVIERAVARAGVREGRVLDLPCGAGRLTPYVAPAARLLVSADYSPAMLGVFARRYASPGLVASAFALPFADRSFDLVFSARLSHHISDEDLRRSYLREVLRVADGAAVVTFFDARSVKNRLRELRRRFSGKRPKNASRREDVEAIAAEAGFRIAAAYPLSRLMSGHVFYVLQRG